MEIKRIFFSVVGIVLLASCSSELTIAKINRPSYNVFKEDIKKVKAWNKQFIENYPENFKEDVESENYYFERKIKTRNHIIDSLQLLKKDRIIIIDSRGDFNGQRAEFSYFFFEDNCVFAGFKRKDSIVRGEIFTKFIPDIKEESKENLEKTYYVIYHIYKTFNESNGRLPDIITQGSERISHLVTLIENNKVNYYSVSGGEKYKVVKLY